jgi:hypothetical protein
MAWQSKRKSMGKGTKVTKLKTERSRMIDLASLTLVYVESVHPVSTMNRKFTSTVKHQPYMSESSSLS